MSCAWARATIYSTIRFSSSPLTPKQGPSRRHDVNISLFEKATFDIGVGLPSNTCGRAIFFSPATRWPMNDKNRLVGVPFLFSSIDKLNQQYRHRMRYRNYNKLEIAGLFPSVPLETFNISYRHYFNHTNTFH